jgi:hypothetical protein
MPGRIGRTAVVAGAAAVALALPGCGSRSQAPESFDASLCREASEASNSLSRVERLEGQFRLRLSADSGPKSGRQAFGDLTLVRRDSAGVPFYGWTSLDPEQVRAHRLGDPGSRDPDAPGVLVLTTPASARPEQIDGVTLRLGSQANRSDIIRFDGAFTALYVRWIERDAFGGDWASGVQGPEASGSFCAVRDGASD